MRKSDEKLKVLRFAQKAMTNIVHFSMTQNQGMP